MSRKLAPIFFVILFSFTLLGCPPAAEQTTSTAAPVIPEIARIENGLRPAAWAVGEPGWRLADRMELYHVPALSIAVIQDYRIAWAKAYGLADADTGQPATTETLFQAASISKPVTAAAALRRVEDGSLDLDAPINEVLKSWQLPENDLTRATPVTLRHLLSHTAGTTVHGFPGYAAGDPVPTLVQVLDGEAPANTPAIRVDIPPGERFRYSGGGISIVQLALTDLAGKSFPELMREAALDPVAMSASTYEQPLPPERLGEASAAHDGRGRTIPGKRHTYPEMAAAGLWTTPSDLARFAVAIQKSWRGDPGALLSQETAREMLTPIDGGAGLGLFIEKKGDATYFQHGGGNEGYRCFLIAHRDAGYGAVLMTNADNGGRLFTEVLRAIAEAYGWEDFLPEPIEPVEVDAEQLAAYVGRYRVGEDRVLLVTRPGNRLVGRLTLFTEEPFSLIPVGEHTFVEQSSGQRLRFRLDESGRADAIVAADPESQEPARERIAGDAPTPAELLDAGRIDEAVAAYRSFGPAEERLNQLGYTLLNVGKTAESVAIFQLNTELYPDSANAYDSLADACYAADDLERAAAAWRQVLEVVPRDTSGDPENLKALQAKAQARLKRLEGHE